MITHAVALIRDLAVDVELKADWLVIRAMPESLCDVNWDVCIEKLCLEHEPLGIIELIAEEYKIRPSISGFEERLLQIWLTLNKEDQQNCSRELLQIDIMRLYN